MKKHYTKLFAVIVMASATITITPVSAQGVHHNNGGHMGNYMRGNTMGSMGGNHIAGQGMMNGNHAGYGQMQAGNMPGTSYGRMRGQGHMMRGNPPMNAAQMGRTGFTPVFVDE